MSAAIRAVILDLGNVLIFHDNDRLARELGAAGGLDPIEVVTRINAADRAAGYPLNTRNSSPESVYDLVAPAIGFPGSFDEFAAIWNGIFWPHEEIVPIVEALQGQVQLLVLSNTNPLHMHYIRPVLPVLDRFDHVLTSYELGLVKPDVAIYQRAIEIAGVRPAEAVFFDDVEGHIEGARRAGLRAFLFTDAPGFSRDLATLGLPAADRAGV